MVEDESRLERCNEFFALEKKDAALFTELLRRFLSFGSSVGFLPDAPEAELRLSRPNPGSLGLTVENVGLVPVEIKSLFSLGGLVEPPNIRFSNPP